MTDTGWEAVDEYIGGRLLADDPAVAAEPRLSATAIQTVGTKGWDGFLLARVER